MGWSGHAADEDECDGEDAEAHEKVGHPQVGCADDKVHGHFIRADGREYERADGDDHTPPSVRAQLALAGPVHVGVPAVAHRAVAARVSRRLGSELALARQVHRAVGAAADGVHEWRGSSALLHADEAHLYGGGWKDQISISTLTLRPATHVPLDDASSSVCMGACEGAPCAAAAAV